MNTQQLITRLAALHTEISRREVNVWNSAQQVADDRNALKDAEAGIILAGVAGKNAEERAAQLRLATREYRERLENSEAVEGQDKLALSALQTELSCLRSIARLIARETE